MVILLILDVQSKHYFISLNFHEQFIFFFSVSITPNTDHSRRLIQTAYAYFQQLNQCNDLNDEQKQWIQTWMEGVTNVRNDKKKNKFNIFY